MFHAKGMLSPCGEQARIVEVPGHTKGHIACLFAEDGGGDLFSGDTVFGGTIGNMFEGTPEVMFETIRKIRALPRHNRIWCSHEYTLQFVRESSSIDPENARLAARLKRLEAEAASGKATGRCIGRVRYQSVLQMGRSELCARFSTKPGIETFRHLCSIT